MPGQPKAYIVFGTTLEIGKNGRSATYIDADGDVVTVKVSKGTLDYSMFEFTTPAGAVKGGRELVALHLDQGGSTFAGANVTFTVKKAKNTGDGLVNVGTIDATGIDIGKVTVKGSLGTILAGDNDLTDEGLKSLTVNRLGGDAANLIVVPNSLIKGGAKSVTVKGHFVDTALTITGALKSLKVTGNLAGDVNANAIATITIGGRFSAATITSTGNVNKFTAGAMDNARLYVGFTPNNVNDPFAGGSFTSGSQLKSFAVSGKKGATITGGNEAMFQSFVIANEIGTATIMSADITGSNIDWGFGYSDRIKKLTLKSPSFTYDVGAGGTQAKDDFRVVQFV